MELGQRRKADVCLRESKKSLQREYPLHLRLEGVGWVCRVSEMGEHHVQRLRADSAQLVLELQIAECYPSINCGGQEEVVKGR